MIGARPYVWVVERVWQPPHSHVDAWSSHGTSSSAAFGAVGDLNSEQSRWRHKYFFRARKYVAEPLAAQPNDGEP